MGGASLLDTAPEWHGVPEVVARGSAYEVGFAHGSQIPHRIAVCMQNYSRLFLETANLNWAAARTRAATHLPALKRTEPDLIEEIQGIADGAGVDFMDIFTLNVRSEIALTNYSDGCTAVVTSSPAKPGVFLAQNWDWMIEASRTTALFDIHKTGKPRIRIMGEAGIVGKFGINDAGVGVCMNAIRSGAINKAQLPVHMALRRVLECRSFDEALGMLTRKGLASCCNIVIADRSGIFASVECTPLGLAPIYPEPGKWTTFHTNHLYSPNIPAGIIDHPVENSFIRLNRIKELSLGKVAGISNIRTWLCDVKNWPSSICRSRPPNADPSDRVETLATVIMDLTQGRLEVSFGQPALGPPVRTLLIE